MAITLTRIDHPANDQANLEFSQRLRHRMLVQRGELRCVAVKAERGTITLEGTVGSYYLKQLAVTLARQTTGVTHVIDHLKVGGLEERAIERCTCE